MKNREKLDPTSSKLKGKRVRRCLLNKVTKEEGEEGSDVAANREKEKGPLSRPYIPFYPS